MHNKKIKHKPQEKKSTHAHLEEIYEKEPALSDRQHIHVKVPGLSDNNLRHSGDTTSQSKLALLMKKQRKERSLKRKIEEEQENKKEHKKEQAIKQLQQEYKKQIASFKPKILKTKILKKTNMQSMPAEQFLTYDGSANTTAAAKGTKGKRSRSRKRQAPPLMTADDEKENRRGSPSPSKSKSEKKKTRKSKSKRRLNQQEQIQDLQYNVIEILNSNKPKPLKKSSTMKEIDSFPPKVLPSQMFASVR